MRNFVWTEGPLDNPGTTVDFCRCGGEFEDHRKTRSGVSYCYHEGFNAKGWLVCKCRGFHSRVT